MNLFLDDFLIKFIYYSYLLIIILNEITFVIFWVIVLDVTVLRCNHLNNNNNGYF